MSVSSTFCVLLLCLVIGEASRSPIFANKVVGTVVISCGQLPYHTPLNAPYPTNQTDAPVWIPGSQSICIRELSDVLRYCQQIYGLDRPGAVERAIVNLFALPARLLPPYPSNVTMQIYLCLGPATSSFVGSTGFPLTQPYSQTTTIRPAHRLPSLIDVHKAYFAEQFRHMSNHTNANVSRLIEHLTRESQGLAKLYQTNPRLAQFSASRMLQDAHKRLEQIWSEEESQWSVLEQARHEDMVRQLESQDWVGENEFTYALQEFTLDLNRVQDALSQLLNRLADSVNEEVHHLKLVQSHQPWALTMKHANWTNHVTRSFTDIERVHDVLLKYVRTATLAINTVRSLMMKDSEEHSPHFYISYKQGVIKSYNRLQNELYEAERLLTEAKTTLLQNVTQRMHSIMDEMHINLTTSNDSSMAASDAFVTEWLRSKHHAELAFIDLLVMRILGASTPIELPTTRDEHPNAVWQPATHTDFVNAPTTAANPKSSVKWTLHSIFASSWAVVVCLCGILAIVIGCLALRCGVAARRHAPYLSQLFTKKWKHLLCKSLAIRSTRVAETPTWKVDRRVVVVADSGNYATGDAAYSAPLLHSGPRSDTTGPDRTIGVLDNVRGYMNPVYPV